jgi:rare lipoprotein A
MRLAPPLPLGLVLLAALVLSACAGPSNRGPVVRPLPKPPARVVPPDADGPPPPGSIPPDLTRQDDPVPRYEPKSKYGNPETYSALGQTYRTMDSGKGYRETGLASWYGRKFHGRKTSSGEPFDMFKLTAAHRTLPLPSYVRVTNLDNGQSIVVRVNDRGPFHKGRIMDLSYAAAAKLGMLGAPGQVELEAITPGEELPPSPGVLQPPKPAAGTPPKFLQVAAYSDPINVVAMREELAGLGIAAVEIRKGTFNGDPIQRVLVGPFDDAAQFTAMRNRLLAAGLGAYPVSQ